jgi:hypothetical protein
MGAIQLFGRTLDARPDRVDLRDRPYTPPLRSLPPEYPDRATIDEYVPRYTASGLVLDQGRDGSCTGFGLAAVVNYLFWRAGLDSPDGPTPARVSAPMLYHLAKFYDEWTGEDYEGSSCRGAMRGWHHHGVCAETLWPHGAWEDDAATRPLGAYYRIDTRSLNDVQAAIHEVGAVYVSASVHDGWAPDRLTQELGLPAPVISSPLDPSKTGGHAFALVGYNRRGFVVQNSWGGGWGNGGFAILPYEDWLQRASDAWVAVMGAPIGGRAPAYRVSAPLEQKSSRRVVTVGTPAAGGAHGLGAAIPSWSEDEAYRHAIVMANNGIVVNNSVASPNAVAALGKAVHDEPLAWLRAHAVRDVVFYAHGGLNGEASAIERARVLGPVFAANDIYPVFFVWKTGFLEAVGDIIEDHIEGQREGAWADVWDTVKEAKDRAIEAFCEGVVVKGVWTQMKQNAEAARIQPNPTLGLTVDHLVRLGSDLPTTANTGLRVHLVGHSAGAILLGHLLDVLVARNVPVASCTLFAPACTVRFALAHYAPAAAGGILRPDDTVIRILSDERERADSVGPYGKSLLYLVSRALEEHHKTPLLGMQHVWLPQASGDDRFGNDKLRDEVQAWQDTWKGPAPIVLSKPTVDVVTGGRETIASAHGCFDNDVATITATLGTIRGAPPIALDLDLRGF